MAGETYAKTEHRRCLQRQKNKLQAKQKEKNFAMAFVYAFAMAYTNKRVLRKGGGLQKFSQRHYFLSERNLESSLVT